MNKRFEQFKASLKDEVNIELNSAQWRLHLFAAGVLKEALTSSTMLTISKDLADLTNVVEIESATKECIDMHSKVKKRKFKEEYVKSSEIFKSGLISRQKSFDRLVVTREELLETLKSRQYMVHQHYQEQIEHLLALVPSCKLERLAYEVQVLYLITKLYPIDRDSLEHAFLTNSKVCLTRHDFRLVSICKSYNKDIRLAYFKAAMYQHFLLVTLAKHPENFNAKKIKLALKYINWIPNSSGICTLTDPQNTVDNVTSLIKIVGLYNLDFQLFEESF